MKLFFRICWVFHGSPRVFFVWLKRHSHWGIEKCRTVPQWVWYLCGTPLANISSCELIFFCRQSHECNSAASCGIPGSMPVPQHLRGICSARGFSGHGRGLYLRSKCVGQYVPRKELYIQNPCVGAGPVKFFVWYKKSKYNIDFWVLEALLPTADCLLFM